MAAVFPRLPLLGIFGMIAVALAGAAAGAARHVATPEPASGAVLARDLVFEDRDDGAVVTRLTSGRTVAGFGGENGVLRGPPRGFARARRPDHLGPASPFRLARWPDGRLTLDDPANGRHAELLAFGPDNAKVFARLLEEAQ